jgi:hypothetical protein
VQPHSSRPHRTEASFDADGREHLQALLPRRPRTYGKPSSRWTLALAAESSFAQVLLPPARSVASETSRLTLK